MCWAICLAAVSSASAQNYGPMPGYGAPNPGTVYSPGGPQGGYGPVWMDQGMQLPQPNGMAQPGEMQNLNFNQALGDYGNVQMYGAPAGDAGFGANFRANPATWGHVRDLQVGVYTNEDQTVITGGSTFEFYVNDLDGFAGRVLLGGANTDSAPDEFHFSGDLYAGTTRLGDHWFKGGVLYDVQDNFSKVGPVFGALLFAEYKHPISVDLAYGIGYGDPLVNRLNSTILTVADDDTQLRAGTYITPNLQAGFSGNWVNFADNRFIDYNGYGGFVNLNLGTLNINVDVTTGEDHTRGFVNVAYTFGGRRLRALNDAGCPIVVEHPRDWLGKPVMRDVALQLQRQQVGSLPPLPVPPATPGTVGVGNITQVNFRFGPGSGGVDGIIDAGETFSVDVQLVNASTAPASQILAGNVFSTSNLGVVLGGPGLVTVGSLFPGQQTNLNLPSFGTIFVTGAAQAGDQFFIDFEVTADGVPRRFRVPVTIGASSAGGAFTATIAL